MTRPALIWLAIVVAAIFIASAFTYASAKQEQVKPERPVPSAQKPIPEPEKCRPAMRFDFWVIGSDGKLKLVGSRIVEGTC